jgi:hypothetical protein
MCLSPAGVVAGVSCAEVFAGIQRACAQHQGAVVEAEEHVAGTPCQIFTQTHPSRGCSIGEAGGDLERSFCQSRCGRHTVGFFAQIKVCVIATRKPGSLYFPELIPVCEGCNQGSSSPPYQGWLEA